MVITALFKMLSARNLRLNFINLLIALLIVAIGSNYIADARRHGGSLTSITPPGYYGLLTEALTAGQANLKIIPDPEFLRLADPYAGPQGTNRPHDMTFYRGKFYLYYGITPALILMVPWRLLTGTYLTEVASSAFFCLAGFLFAALWLLRVHRCYFSSVNIGWVLLCLAVLGIGSPIYFLGNNPTFYAVPIAAAFFCLMLAGLLVDNSNRSQAAWVSLIWLAAASLVLGLAVGARPNYVAGLCLLLMPTLRSWQSLPEGQKWNRDTKLLASAAILPAALIGAGLAYYNYIRFGSIVEFGIRYSLSTVNQSNMTLIGPEFYPKNLQLYLFHTADFIRYFPFFHAGDRPFGMLPHFTLAGAALLFPLNKFRQKLPLDHRWINSSNFWLGTSCANLAILCLFFGGEDRYLIDFVPGALLLGCALLLACIKITNGWNFTHRILTQTAILGLALWTLANGASFAFSRRVASPLLTKVEQYSNSLVAKLETVGTTHHGPIEFKIRFPINKIGSREPLLSTGTLVGTGDIVYVVYPDAEHVQFGFFHLGAGGPISPPIAIDYAATHRVTIHLGSLYPPRQHPLFKTWSEAQVNKVRRRLDIALNGQPALQASVNVYNSTPDGINIGSNHLAADVCQTRFTGEILSTQRLGARPPPIDDQSSTGPVRLTLRFPAGMNTTPQPLVSTGQTGSGDLLSVQMTEDGKIRFIHDCWGSSDFTTEALSPIEKQEHTVDIEMGSLYAATDSTISPLMRRRLAIWLDDQLAVDIERPFNSASPDTVEFGFNAIQASSATGMFTGSLIKSERIASRPRAVSKEIWGPLALKVRFPIDAVGLKEPLICLGTFGAADIIFVHYIDKTHIQFGLDHWGSALTLGPIIEIQPESSYNLTFDLASLYPPVGHQRNPKSKDLLYKRNQDMFRVLMDEQIVFSSFQKAYPSTQEQVAIGRNDLSAASCRRLFSGEILSQKRLVW
jgi:hypothetical protein